MISYVRGSQECQWRVYVTRSVCPPATASLKRRLDRFIFHHGNYPELLGAICYA